MNGLDALVATIFICSTVIGVVRGLVKEVFSLVGWIVAAAVANAFAAQAATWLPEVVPGNVLRVMTAFVALFILVKLLLWLLALTAEQLVKAGGLSAADRGLGALFGVMRALVLCWVLATVCGLTRIPQQEFWRTSVTAPWLSAAAEAVLPWLPGDLARHVKF